MFVGGHTRKIMGVTETPLRMASASSHKFIGGITMPDPHLEEIALILGGIDKEMRIANQLKLLELDQQAIAMGHADDLGPEESWRYRQLRKKLVTDGYEKWQHDHTVVIGED